MDILLTKLAYGYAEYGPPNPYAEDDAANAPPYDGICAAADDVVSVGAVAVAEDAANIVLFVWIVFGLVAGTSRDKRPVWVRPLVA